MTKLNIKDGSRGCLRYFLVANTIYLVGKQRDKKPFSLGRRIFLPVNLGIIMMEEMHFIFVVDKM